MAVDAVRPFAVDVNSGVEDEHGDKRADRSSGFVSTVRGTGPLSPSMDHLKNDRSQY
jgi:hypothetical protein